MRLPLLASAVATALTLTACGTSSEDADTAAPSPTPEATVSDLADDAATDEPSEEDTHDEEEGEPRDPDAVYAEELCATLVPAMYGETEGLERYATDEVLAQLADLDLDRETAEMAEAFDYADGERCSLTLGDVEYVITYQGDGHVGHSAVGFETSMGLDNPSNQEPVDVDREAIAAAVTEVRPTGEVCDGDAAELPEGAGDHVVFALPQGAVVAIVCDTFAYQNTYDLRGWDGSSLTSLDVQQWRGGELVSDPIVLGFPDTEGSTIANLEKARGLGDCGLFQRWFLAGDRLELAEARERACDDEAEYVEPSEWDRVHPAAG